MVNDRLQPRSDWSSAGRLAILSSVLFLSGIGSLIFETLWLRLSGLTFGNSIWSAALILSSARSLAAPSAFFMVSTPSELWPVRCWVKLIWSRPLDFWEPLSQPARQHPLPQPPPCCWRDATAPPSPPRGIRCHCV